MSRMYPKLAASKLIVFASIFVLMGGHLNDVRHSTKSQETIDSYDLDRTKQKEFARNIKLCIH